MDKAVYHHMETCAAVEMLVELVTAEAGQEYLVE